MSAAISTMRRGKLECLCGCGGTPKGGRYLRGHDQKLRKQLEAKVGGLPTLKAIVEALERHFDGDLSKNTVRKILQELEELESIRAFDAAKTSGDEAVPFEQAVEEIEQSRR